MDSANSTFRQQIANAVLSDHEQSHGQGEIPPFQSLRDQLAEHDKLLVELGEIKRVVEALETPPEKQISASKTNPLGQRARPQLQVWGIVIDLTLEHALRHVREHQRALLERMNVVTGQLKTANRADGS